MYIFGLECFVIHGTEARESIYLFTYFHSHFLHLRHQQILIDALPIFDNRRKNIVIWIVEEKDFQRCPKPFRTSISSQLPLGGLFSAVGVPFECCMPSILRQWVLRRAFYVLMMTTLCWAYCKKNQLRSYNHCPALYAGFLFFTSGVSSYPLTLQLSVHRFPGVLFAQ